MSSEVQALSCEIEVKPGEKLSLPEALTDNIGPGRWLLTIRPLVRDHRAFLNGYAPEDEGLYDDDPGR